MSISTEIARLQAARNKLRTKAVALGIGLSTDKLDDLADEFDAIVNRGAVSATVQEGDTYTIPAGFHNGAGTVSGVSGGGNYTLQSKGPIAPTRAQQAVTADNGYYGLSDVTIGPIPSAYQDVSSVTAIAAHVLANDIFVAADGTIVPGTMPNNGTIAQTIDGLTAMSFVIPAGCHSGSGTVSLTNDIEQALAAI